MIVTAEDVNSFLLYTSRRSLQFLATRLAISATISMLASVGIGIALQLPPLLYLTFGAAIACAVVWARLKQLKKNEISAMAVLGGKVFVYLPKLPYGQPSRFEASITKPSPEEVESMISFDFPGYGWAMRKPTTIVHKSRMADHGSATPSEILMEGQIIFA